eukprot:tig00000334_g24104.t1
MLGSAQLSALHHRDLASMPAGVFHGRAAAPMLAKWPRGSRRLPCQYDHPVAELAQITFRDDFLAQLPGRWATGIAAAGAFSFLAH